MNCTNYKKDGTNGSLWCALILTAVFLCAGISCSRQESVQRIYSGEEKGITAPEVLVAPNPAYTEEARVARAGGIVVLKAVIRKDGSADSFKVVRGLGYGLDESAISTIASKWRFKPATYKGQPVDYQVDIEVAFQMY